MLTDYCQAVLKAELASLDYDGKTADQAWAWLTQPVPQSPVPTGLLFTPVVMARVLGPAKANAVAAAVKAQFPAIADGLLAEGVDPLNPDAAGFLTAMVAANVLTASDLDKIGTATTVVPPPLPPRYDVRFSPARWSHVAPDGTAGGPDDPAIHEFPNTIDRADFDAAWTAAGRS